MNVCQNELQRADRRIWLAIAMVAIIDLGAVCTGSFTVAWSTFVLPAATGTALALAGTFYRAIRKDQRAASALICTAQMIAFASVGASLSYIAARTGWPLLDAAYEATDRRLGVDWTAYATFVTGHGWLRLLLSAAYASFAVQLITTVLALGFTGQLLRLSIFMHAFILTTLATIGISAIAPAVGPWMFYDIQSSAMHGMLPVSSTSWPVFLGLRDGTFNLLSGLNSEGIITFPSLHAALAVLFVIAIWRTHGLRWLSLAVNGLMLLATPIDGSHYVIDVIAGVCLALICWRMAARILKTQDTPNATELQTAASPSIVPDIAGAVPTGSLTLDLPRADSRADVTQSH